MVKNFLQLLEIVILMQVFISDIKKLVIVHPHKSAEFLLVI